MFYNVPKKQFSPNKSKSLSLENIKIHTDYVNLLYGIRTAYNKPPSHIIDTFTSIVKYIEDKNKETKDDNAFINYLIENKDELNKSSSGSKIPTSLKDILFDRSLLKPDAKIINHIPYNL